MRISKMTNGSTYAVIPSSPSPVKAITMDIVAAASRIYTRVSSNCSMILSQRVLSSSLSSSFFPCSFNLLSTSAELSPVYRLVLKCFSTSATDNL